MKKIFSSVIAAKAAYEAIFVRDSLKEVADTMALEGAELELPAVEEEWDLQPRAVTDILHAAGALDRDLSVFLWGGKLCDGLFHLPPPKEDWWEDPRHIGVESWSRKAEDVRKEELHELHFRIVEPGKSSNLFLRNRSEGRCFYVYDIFCASCPSFSAFFRTDSFLIHRESVAVLGGGRGKRIFNQLVVPPAGWTVVAFCRDSPEALLYRGK